MGNKAIKPKRSGTGKTPRLKLYGRIHGLMAEAGISDDTYRDILAVNFDGAASKSELNNTQLFHLVQHLEGLVPGRRSSYPGRPRNMDRGGSRADQLDKIEALLTVGRKEWSYADSIARNMKLADRVAWVKDGDLYKVITALRKQAQREGWDLSGEKR